jgi:hypothetical protein
VVFDFPNGTESTGIFQFFVAPEANPSCWLVEMSAFTTFYNILQHFTADQDWMVDFVPVSHWPKPMVPKKTALQRMLSWWFVFFLGFARGRNLIRGGSTPPTSTTSHTLANDFPNHLYNPIQQIVGSSTEVASLCSWQWLNGMFSGSPIK